MANRSRMTCSLIGSFRKHYPTVCQIAKVFEDVGIRVLSPKVSEIVDPDEWFVRLDTDNQDHSPVEIQLIALSRILRSSFVYIVCPDGYVGNTTCYEIGRIVERRIPLFFSEFPKDLPMPIPDGSVIAAGDLAARIADRGKLPQISLRRYSKLVRQLHYSLLRKPGQATSPTPRGETLPSRRVIVCGSMSKYEEMVECARLLESTGVSCIIPEKEGPDIQTLTSKQFELFKRKVSSDYLAKIRSTYTFGVLVVNTEKKGLRNYIGANAFAEIAVAFNARKRIYLLEDIYDVYADELIAWSAIPLCGALDVLIDHYSSATASAPSQIQLFPDVGS